MSAAAPAPAGAMGRILATVVLSFVGFLTIALPLAVLPGYVARDLGFGASIAGLTIGLQSLSTVVSRAQVGRMADLYGPKRAVTWGFVAALVSGALTLLGALAQGVPGLSLGLLLAARLVLGIGESWVSTGAIAWAIGQVGPEHMVRIIAWNGIATYGALAVGAPIGVALAAHFGFASIGAVSCLLAALGLAVTLAKAPVAVIVEERLPMRSVIARVMPYGCILATAASGFGVIAAFITLYFDARHWAGASLSITLFGLGFIAWRLFLSDTILRYGGLRITFVFFGVEAAGLILLCLAPSPYVAMAGAGIAGFGFSPIFPALGSVAVGRVPPQNRGAAIGLYSVFFDVSLGLTGPLSGLLIDRAGPVAPFWLAAGASLIGLAMTGVMLTR